MKMNTTRLRYYLFVPFLVICFVLTATILIWKLYDDTFALLAERTDIKLYKHVGDRSYISLPRIVDPERRQERLGSEKGDKLVDMTAFAGTPEPYSEVVSKFIEAVLSTIKAIPITRQRYYHEPREGEPYPDFVNPIYERDVVVPLVILPRPDAVRRWSASTAARSLGWCAEDKAITDMLI